MRRQPDLLFKTPEIGGIPSNASLEEAAAKLNVLITEYSKALKTLSFRTNFDGLILENVVIPATSALRISHLLGVKPKWRIILNQVGNGVITDIPSDWNDEVISLYNNGAVEVTLTVFIARE